MKVKKIKYLLYELTNPGTSKITNMQNKYKTVYQKCKLFQIKLKINYLSHSFLDSILEKL